MMKEFIALGMGTTGTKKMHKTYFKEPKPERGTKACKEHLKLIKSLPCCVCSSPPPNDAHHIKNNTGLALKSSDFETIPLCSSCHYDFHHGIGKKEWEKQNKPQTEYLEEIRLLVDKRTTNSYTRDTTKKE